jgi:predicted esterase
MTASSIRLLVWLHGHEDEPSGRGAALARSIGCEVMEPRGPVELPGGPAWFSSDAGGPNEEELIDALDELEHMITRETERHGFERPQVAIGGTSQGGAVALAFALREPGFDGFVGAVCCVNGWLPWSDDLVYDAPGLAAAGTRVLIVTSRDDEVVPPESGRSAARYLDRAGAKVKLVELAADHTVGDDAIGAVADWLASGQTGTS